MSQVDKIKEEIGWLKIIFATLAAIDISLIAWLVQNFAQTHAALLTGAIGGILCTTIMLIWINRSVYRKIEKLEEL